MHTSGQMTGFLELQVRVGLIPWNSTTNNNEEVESTMKLQM